MLQCPFRRLVLLICLPRSFSLRSTLKSQVLFPLKYQNKYKKNRSKCDLFFKPFFAATSKYKHGGNSADATGKYKVCRNCRSLRFLSMCTNGLYLLGKLLDGRGLCSLCSYFYTHSNQFSNCFSLHKTKKSE